MEYLKYTIIDKILLVQKTNRRIVLIIDWLMSVCVLTRGIGNITYFVYHNISI